MENKHAARRMVRNPIAALARIGILNSSIEQGSDTQKI
jgi:hypothetical protein